MSEVVITKQFNVPVAAVWDALTQKEKMKDWYFDIKNFSLDPGAEFSFWGDDASQTYLHVCKVLKAEPNKVLEHTWTHPNESKGSSVLRWELEPINDTATMLTMTHSGLDSFADAGPAFSPENYEFGWDGIVNNSLRNHLYGYKKVVVAVDIKAPKTKVWQMLWDKESYTKWVGAFSEGSRYEGNLEVGGRVHFLAPNNDGLYADVIFMIENELMIFRHIGTVKNAEEQEIDEDTDLWTGVCETYRLSEKNGVTQLIVELDTNPQYYEFMHEGFVKAMDILKSLCEA